MQRPWALAKSNGLILVSQVLLNKVGILSASRHCNSNHRPCGVVPVAFELPSALLECFNCFAGDGDGASRFAKQLPNLAALRLSICVLAFERMALKTPPHRN
jgi:hypothetical protein